ncbi:MAG TPA: hypothetical protein ENH41_02445 [Candidatus Omnitrophica bacterium]|nr:hypothetical protein [Candidatus Omnitrophota bacterium]
MVFICRYFRFNSLGWEKLYKFMYSFVFIFYGLFSMLAQLLILRELSVLFLGSELFLGTYLSSWLFWVGGGSLFIKRLLKNNKSYLTYFSYGFLALSILLPVVILFIRASRGIFSFGRLIGPFASVIFIFSVMSLICFVIGSQFSLASAVISGNNNKRTALGRIYLCEALGAVLGGILFTYFLIGKFPIFNVARVLSLFCIAVFFMLLFKVCVLRSIFLKLKNSVIFFLGLVMLLAIFTLEPAINRIQWRGYKIIAQKETPNANLSLLSLGSTENVFINGVLSASFPNPEKYEPITHWPLLAIKQPKNILVVGETSFGILKEVVKHDPQYIDYLTLEDDFIKFLKLHLDRRETSILNDARIKTHHMDTRLYVQSYGGKYDAIIMNLPEVSSLKLNRFYTKEFFSGVKKILNEKGIFALSISSSENYRSKATQIFNASVYATLNSVFNFLEVIPGDDLILLASASEINLDKNLISRRISNRAISNIYAVRTYFAYKLDDRRRTKLVDELKGSMNVEINHDFYPKTYQYFTKYLQNKFAFPVIYFIVCVVLAFIPLFLFRKGRAALGEFFKREECVLIFSIGFMSIVFEFVLLLGFQIISGFVYWQIGLLFACFMSGLFFGSSLGMQFKDRSEKVYFYLLNIISLLFVSTGIALSHYLPFFINLPTVANIPVFSLCLVFIGFLAGLAFVFCSFRIGEDDIMVKSGKLYSADLWGAALGGLLAGNVIVPFVGLLGALKFSSFLGLLGLLAFVVINFKRP